MAEERKTRLEQIQDASKRTQNGSKMDYIIKTD